jgi:hypothetical protein
MSMGESVIGVPGGRLGRAVLSGAGDVLTNALNAKARKRQYSMKNAFTDFSTGIVSQLVGEALSSAVIKYGKKVKAPKGQCKTSGKDVNGNMPNNGGKKPNTTFDLQLFAKGSGNSNSWNTIGTFGGKSLQKHFDKHGKEVGAESVEQYLRKAEAFKQNLKGAKTSRIDGSVEGVIRYKKLGKYIDLAPDGTIVSFGKQ